MQHSHKDFDEAYSKLQETLARKDDTDASPMGDKVSEFSTNLLHKYLTTYLVYLQAKSNPGQVSELLSLFQESTLKEISRQTELAHDKLGDDPMFNMMSNLFQLPSIEGIEGLYIQEINKLVVAYRDLFGLPQLESAD